MGSLANAYRVDAHGKKIKGGPAPPMVTRELKPHKSTEKAAGGQERHAKANEPVGDDVHALRQRVAALTLSEAELKAKVARLEAQIAAGAASASPATIIAPPKRAATRRKKKRAR